MVSVRISEEDKKRLTKHGKLSEAVREAVRRYLDSEDSEVVFERLRELQRKDKVNTTPEEMARMIKGDRLRDSSR